MKPEQFIRDFGVEKAREVLRGPPALECYFVPKYQQYFVDKHGFVYVLGMFGYFTPSLGMTIENLTEHGFQISELKRLVNSVNEINGFGGIGMAKLMNQSVEGEHLDLEQAIHDHESIYGGGDE